MLSVLPEREDRNWYSSERPFLCVEEVVRLMRPKLGLRSEVSSRKRIKRPSQSLKKEAGGGLGLPRQVSYFYSSILALAISDWCTRHRGCLLRARWRRGMVRVTFDVIYQR